MGKLDSLKIDDCPYAFASFAAKHNALCDLIAGMVGENGISVVVAEKNAIIRGNTAAGSLGNVPGTTANVVGSDGRLQNVYTAGNIANAYPAFLRANGTLGRYAWTDGDNVVVQTDTLSQYSKITESHIILFNNPYTLDIDAFNLSQNIGIKEIDVCGGQKMLVIGSDPYTP